MTLDPNSIEGAIRELAVYNEQLEQKLDTLKTRVAEEIGNLAQQIASGAVVGDLFWVKGSSGQTIEKAANINITIDSSGNSKLVMMNGEDAVWVEFGTGVWFNGAAGTSPNAFATNVSPSMTIGSYDKGHGKRNVWFFKDGGETYMTHGVPALMPLYRACTETRNRIAEIAREVFAS